ncbi:PAS domain-containing serine/threonine-protein kinase [Scaptodrosophila lebanonensis]|uniref:PAS domain-containing serine/threonine-protein kinase n=1 Tax=Drosophila lebanonensis TaxID=7225 RepID=A0A6J2UFV2_DROLE|nr:PAS domain-containing serine/threonine-protein kinase [Scaptodrosophila lebanonensis]
MQTGKMEKNQGDAASNGFRYSQPRSSMLNFTSNTFNNPPHVSKTINPNKAVFTIDAHTGKIFIVNNNACQLLGYTSHELRRKSFFDLLHCKSDNHISALAEMQIDSDEGIVVLLSGKVIEMKTSYNTKVVVSLWIRQIDNDGRNIAVAEPVQRHICLVSVDRCGVITSADSTTATIFLYESVEDIVGVHISSLIPFIKLPDPDCKQISKSLRKQRATGRTTDNVKFPLCLHIAPYEPTPSENISKACFQITIWVFQNLSGLIVVDEMGNIQTCNQPFSLLMFGYSQEKITNMHISSILPNFGKDLQEDKSPNISNTSITSNEWEPESDPFDPENEPSFQLNKKNTIAKPSSQSTVGELTNDLGVINKTENTGDICSTVTTNTGKLLDVDPEVNDLGADDALTPVNTSNEFLEPEQDNARSMQNAPLDSTSNSLSSKLLSCRDGRYIGEAIHEDGTIIDVLYSVSIQVLPCSNREYYCIWVCRDPNTRFDNDKYANLTLTFNSMTSTVEPQSLGQVIKTTAAQNSSRPNSLSLVSKYEDEIFSGEYSKHYTSIKQIGKGAYGYVKLAFRNSDRLLVITKFILKEKLCAEFMVKSHEGKDIPIEIHLLQTLKHPNVVSAMDVFENDFFYQLVMEKHGPGIDLFEFIERRPLIDEKLGSYIFRQIANAVNYLHEQKILHRDIKDENIIIDHHFNIKLIDFGSATFMEEGKYYSTFYGTTEYCSPEVLAGNKYAGPELEVWSLGVTLYVLMFFENPFIDVEETLKADVHIPSKISEQLKHLLISMLNKDPKFRCTMKTLINDPWVTQEVNASLFNFAWIVPCKPHEANPDIFFSGQLYSSTSVLSTISPQDSFSQIDECSIEESIEEKSLTHKTETESFAKDGKVMEKYQTSCQQDMPMEDKIIFNRESRALSTSKDIISYVDHFHLQTNETRNKLSLSKSENNIHQDTLDPSVSVYNVVSLHDVNLKTNPLNCKLNHVSNLHISKEGVDFHLSNMESQK